MNSQLDDKPAILEVPSVIFATNNPAKLREVREILGDRWNVLSLSDIGCNEDLPETASTLQGNAEMKARYVADRYGIDCFADDTGLLVDALGGQPGVFSARYAGEGHDSEANMQLLLKNLHGIDNRKARFVTVIALTEGSSMKIFKGECCGEITLQRHGNDGFGYDPIFLPEGSTRTFAEMSHDEKNSVSHRGRAMRLLLDYFKEKANK